MREINHWSRRYEELKLQEQAGKQVRLPAQVAKERAEVLVSRLEKRLAQLQAEAQITAKVPVLKGGVLVCSRLVCCWRYRATPSPSVWLRLSANGWNCWR